MSLYELTFLTLLFGVRWAEPLLTTHQQGSANFAFWKSFTSWMIQMGQASTRGVNFFPTVTTNILNLSKILISIFQTTKSTKNTTNILSILNCILQLFFFSVLFIHMYLFIHNYSFKLISADEWQMSRNKFVQNWCVNS